MSHVNAFWDTYQDIKDGKQLIKLFDGEYKYANNVLANQLEQDMLLGVAWSSSSAPGFDYVKLLGVYAVHVSISHDMHMEHLHHSVKEALKSIDATSLANIDPDFQIRLFTEDLEGEGHRDSGDWYYLHKGRFCRGSGADSLTFFEIRQADQFERSSRTKKT